MAGQNVITFDANTSALSAKLASAQRAARGIGEQFSRGTGGLDELVRKAGGFLAVSKLIASVWSEEITKPMERAKGLVAGRHTENRFYSLPRFSSQEGQQQADQLFNTMRIKGGMDRDTALGGLFAMESRGVLNQDNTDAIASLYRTGQVQDLEETVNSIKNTMEAFGKTDFIATLETVLAGAAGSQADFQQFAKALGEAGVLAKTTGTSFEDMAAVLASLGGEGIERLRTKINALNADLMRAGYKGGLENFIAESVGKPDSTLRREGVRSTEAVQAVLLLRQAYTSGALANAKAGVAGAEGGLLRSVVLRPDRLKVRDTVAQQEQRTQIAQESEADKMQNQLILDQLNQEARATGVLRFWQNPLSYLSHVTGTSKNVLNPLSSDESINNEIIHTRQMIDAHYEKLRHAKLNTAGHDEISTTKPDWEK